MDFASDPIARRIREAASRGTLSHALLFSGSGDFKVLRWTGISAVPAAFPRNGCGRKIWKKQKNTGRERPNERNFMELTSKQRAQLRGLANTIDTIIHIGKDGIGENLVKQTDDALEARELIKGRVLENNIEYDARLAAQELAKATRSEVVQVIGTKFVLYRESHSKPREKRIQLVKPSKKRQA